MPRGFSRSEYERISRELSQQLGPEFLSSRKGEGVQSVLYLEGNKAIELANEIFGFDGWSSESRKVNIDFSKKEGDRFSVGIMCIIRITLKDGTFKEDIGFGTAINQKSPPQALEKAYKEAYTDAMKRAFRQFGSALGNCIYDKGYASFIRGLSADEPKVEVQHLRRPKSKSAVNEALHNAPDPASPSKLRPVALDISDFSQD